MKSEKQIALEASIFEHVSSTIDILDSVRTKEQLEMPKIDTAIADLIDTQHMLIILRDNYDTSDEDYEPF